MSHEIRTPMNGIIGMLTLAENKLEANSPAMQYLTKADELRISQVIINFLSNAVKFTAPGGKIRTEIEEEKRINGFAIFKISVSDTGIGMTPEFLEKLYQPFEQETGIVSVDAFDGVVFNFNVFEV